MHLVRHHSAATSSAANAGASQIYQQSVGAAPILCTLEGAVCTVVGILAGDPNDIRHDDRTVARAGDKIEFGQVNLVEHEGTFADPYFALGLVLGGCYPRPH